MKKLLKKIIPKRILRPLLPFFHWLQAAFWNLRYGLPARGKRFIVITGTNGKTTTAAFLGKILEQTGQRVGISTTAFFQVGSDWELNDTNMTVTAPSRLFKLIKDFRNAGVDWIILEVTSHALEQNRILGVPVYAAVMTNLTQDHLDYHGSMDKYAEAKGKLFAKKPRFSILNRDDEWFHFFDRFVPRERVLTYGIDPDAEVKILKAKLGPQGSKLAIKLEQAQIEPTTHLVGKFNAYNALAAAATAHAVGIDPVMIEKGLEELETVPGRMEVIEDKKRGVKMVVDYAHTPDALANVLDSLRAINKNRIITVFGATGDRDKAKRPLMGKVVAEKSDIAIVTDDDTYSENPITIRAEVLQGAQNVVNGADIYEVGDRREAIAKAIELAKRGDVILLAGIGHQRYRVIDGEKVEWSEKEVAKVQLAKS